MARNGVLVSLTAILCLGLAPHAAAEPVIVTSGSLVFPPEDRPGSISIFGTQGFSLQGVVISAEGRVDPISHCQPCEPHEIISIGAHLGGIAIVGDATLRGTLYPDIGTPNSYPLAVLELGGMTELPPVQGSSIVITAPFTLLDESLFVFPVTPVTNPEAPDLEQVLLRGGGMATLALRANPSMPVWEFDHLRYDFQPIPEPATLVLVGGSLVGVMLGRGLRRAGCRTGRHHSRTNGGDSAPSRELIEEHGHRS